MAKFFQSLENFTNALNQINSLDSQGDIAEPHKTEVDGGVDGGAKTKGVQSMFNAFNVFKYSKFGQNTDTYDIDGHMDSTDNTVESSVKEYQNRKTKNARKIAGVTDSLEKLKLFKEESQKIENPTASAIIEWARKQGGAEPNNPAINPMPYAICRFGFFMV